MNHADAPIEPADRATPPCPHFGPCGGCQLQHLIYPAQLALKATQLTSLLAPLGLTLPEMQLHFSPPLAYRNRIRLTLGEIDGRLRAGYMRADPETRDANLPSFLPITQCPIAAPILWRATEAFLALIPEHRASLRTAQYIPDQLELFTAPDESGLQITLFLRTAAKSLPKDLSLAFTAFCEALHARILELTGAILTGAGIALLPPTSTQRSRRAETIRPGPTWGSSGLNYSIPAPHNNLPHTAYWVPPGAFFQANRYLLPELLTLVTGNRAGGLAWDLYAGVGLFSRALAGTFARVTTVEIAEPAATALASTGLQNLAAIKATTLDFLRTAVLQRDRPGLIVLDPPRTGAGPEVCALLARIAAPTLIYVSCSPQTLPADLKTLTANGYRIAELHLLDLFPQTTHIETVAILTR